MKREHSVTLCKSYNLSSCCESIDGSNTCRMGSFKKKKKKKSKCRTLMFSCVLSTIDKRKVEAKTVQEEVYREDVVNQTWCHPRFSHPVYTVGLGSAWGTSLSRRPFLVNFVNYRRDGETPTTVGSLCGVKFSLQLRNTHQSLANLIFDLWGVQGRFGLRS